MSDVSAETLRYLAPSEDAFWRWSGERDAIEWTGGGTIAFRQEIQEALRPFESRGFPPLDMVVLTLAACRETWPSDSGQLVELERALSLRLRTIAGKWHEDAVRQLGKVYQLPAALRTSLAGKVSLIETVLERHPVRTTSEQAREILALLDSAGWMRAHESPSPLLKSIGQWSIELRGLCDGLRRVDEETIRQRLRTGLDRVPRPLPADEVEPEEPAETPTVTRLIEELLKVDEFAGLMRLAKNLTAVVSLPRPLAEPEELPLGGVSDISNRGPLDRLLLSELAHDDDTLMTRIALNEALYLRRETPPTHPPRDRILILDSGLRMWGVPRVYVTAAALALAAMAERDGTARVFRGAGDTLAPVDLTTRAGLEEHLAALDPRLHPGSALPDVAKLPASAEAEVIVLTSEEVHADHAFRRSLAEHLPVCYAGLVTREGDFQLLSRSLRGTRTLRRARLDLSVLFESRGDQPAPKLLDDDHGAALPAILRLAEFPLRLPSDLASWRNLIPLSEGDDARQRYAILTGDQRLLLWEREPNGARRFGGREVTRRMPPGDLVWWQYNASSTILQMVVGRARHAELFYLEVHVGQGALDNIVKLQLPIEPVLGIAWHHGLLSLRYADVDLIHPGNGKILHTSKVPPGATWKHGRFYKSPEGWDVASAMAGRVVWDRIPLSPASPVGRSACLFDSPARGGLVGVCSTGEVLLHVPDEKGRFQPLGKISLSLSHDTRIEAANQDGSLVVLNPGASLNARRYVLRLSDPLQCHEVPMGRPDKQARDPYKILNDGYWRQIPQRTLYKRYRSIGVSEGRLALVSVKGHSMVFMPPLLAPSQLHMQRASAGFDSGDQRPFETDRTPAGSGFTLSEARWPDGSTATLDSRGLLHCRSSDSGIPEFTLVLSESRVSGWCADGRRWGDEYFLGPNVQTVTDHDILHSLLRPFLRSLT